VGEGPFYLSLEPSTSREASLQWALHSPSFIELVRMPFVPTAEAFYLATVQGRRSAGEALLREVKGALRILKALLHTLEEEFSRKVYLISPEANHFSSLRHAGRPTLAHALYRELFHREVVMAVEADLHRESGLVETFHLILPLPPRSSPAGKPFYAVAVKALREGRRRTLPLTPHHAIPARLRQRSRPLSSSAPCRGGSPAC